MKKQILALALGILLGSSIFLGATAVAGENIKLIVNGAAVQCDVPPQIINGRVMVPVRFVADALGAEVDWNSATQTVIINSDKTSGGSDAVEQRFPEDTELIIKGDDGRLWKYNGPIVNGMANGQGIAIVIEDPISDWKGAKYIGYYINNKKSGQGTLTWTDLGSYIGEWKNDFRDGQGTETYSNVGKYHGGKYIGNWENGKKDGQGTYIWANGDTYVGQFKDGIQNGQGTHTCPDGRRYVGQWENGRATGQGMVYLANGTIGTLEDMKFVYN